MRKTRPLHSPLTKALGASMNNPMIQGSCLCGSLKFEIDPSAIVLFNRCYCTRCRKNTGTAHTSSLQVQRESFVWLSDQDSIQSYDSSPGVNRAFCKVCGSRAPQRHSLGKLVSVPAGLLDEFPDIYPDLNIHVQSKAPWDKLDDDIPSIPNQGSDEFWHEFMEQKSSNT